MTSTWTFQSMCEMSQRADTTSFVTNRCVLRELFAKTHGGPFDTPTSAMVIIWITQHEHTIIT